MVANLTLITLIPINILMSMVTDYKPTGFQEIHISFQEEFQEELEAQPLQAQPILGKQRLRLMIHQPLLLEIKFN